MKIVNKTEVIFLEIIISLLVWISSSRAEGIIIQYKAEVDQTRKYRVETPNVKMFSGGVTTEVLILDEKITELTEDGVIKGKISLKEIQGAHPGKVSEDYSDLLFNKQGYGFDRGRKAGTESVPISYSEAIGSKYFLPIFSKDSIQVGGQWTVDVYMGQDLAWYGFVAIYPVHFVYIFDGMETKNGRNCARITYQFQGSKQGYTNPEEKDRYDRSIQGNGMLYFDPQAGLIVHHYRKIKMINISESWTKISGQEEFHWERTGTEVKEREFTIDLLEVIPLGGK